MNVDAQLSSLLLSFRMLSLFEGGFKFMFGLFCMNCNVHKCLVLLYSSPVRKYRKSYCSHPGVSVGVGVGVAQMLMFLVKVFKSLYLLKLLMDQVDIMHVGRYWSEALCCIIMTHLGDLEVKVTDLEILCESFWFKFFLSSYLLNMLMDQVDTLHVGRYWSEVLCCIITTHLGDHEVKVTDFKILC